MLEKKKVKNIKKRGNSGQLKNLKEKKKKKYQNDDIDSDFEDLDDEKIYQENLALMKKLETGKLEHPSQLEIEKPDEKTPTSKPLSTDELRAQKAKDYLDKLAKQNPSLVPSEAEEDAENQLSRFSESGGDPLLEKLKRDSQMQKQKVPKDIDLTIKSSSLEDISITHYKGHKKSATCICLTLDDSKVYTGSKDSSIIQWDVESGKKTIIKGLHKNANGHAGHIFSIAVSYDGRYLATGGADKIIKIWDARSHKLIDNFKGHSNHISGLQFKLGNHELLSTSHDRTIRIWDVNEMMYVESLYGSEDSINSLDIFPGDKYALSCGDDFSLRLWSIRQEMQSIYRSEKSIIEGVGFLENSSVFVSGSQNGSISLWSKSKRKAQAKFLKAHGGEGITSVGSLHHSSVFATGSCDGYLKFWKGDLRNCQILLLKQIPMRGFINGIKFSNSGKFAVAARGSEHRFGRWKKIEKIKHGISIVKF